MNVKMNVKNETKMCFEYFLNENKFKSKLTIVQQNCLPW